MALTFDWSNKVVESSASITDLPAFHADLRDAEDDAIGMIYPIIHNYKRLDLGAGAYFHAVDFVNGWTLKFPAAGNYTINGNLNCTIVPVAGVYVERKTSAAFATTAVGGSGPSASDVADAVLAAAQVAPIHADAKRMNGAAVAGDGTSGNLWRGA
jgi:hypothetical protein